MRRRCCPTPGHVLTLTLTLTLTFTLTLTLTLTQACAGSAPRQAMCSATATRCAAQSHQGMVRHCRFELWRYGAMEFWSYGVKPQTWMRKVLTTATPTTTTIATTMR